jgi:hypothetical protein
MISIIRAAICATVFMITAAGAGELNLAAVVYKLPDQIEWKSLPGITGLQQVVLVGDPAKPGLYMQLVKWLPGNMSHPHFHPNDRFITVLKRTWWVGTGTKFNPDSTVLMPAGTFVTHFGKQVHYDGARDRDTDRRRRAGHHHAGGGEMTGTNTAAKE